MPEAYPLYPQHTSGSDSVSAHEMHYKLMRLLDANPQMSQRDIARELGISLGKANYCLRALITKGWIKAATFTNSQNKAAYKYLLTPRGLEEKAGLAVRFLQAKMREYETLRAEIKQIRREAKDNGGPAQHRMPGASTRKLRNEPLS